MLSQRHRSEIRAVEVQAEMEGNLISMLWTIQLMHNASFNPPDNSKNRLEGGGARGRVIEAHRCEVIRLKLHSWEVVQPGCAPGLSATEACALSVSPRRSWLSFNGCCPAPRPQVRDIKAVCSQGWCQEPHG